MVPGSNICSLTKLMFWRGSIQIEYSCLSIALGFKEYIDVTQPGCQTAADTYLYIVLCSFKPNTSPSVTLSKISLTSVTRPVRLSFASKHRHVTEKHVLTGRKRDMLGNQTFEVVQPLIKLLLQSWKVFKFFYMFSINKYGKTSKQVFLCPRMWEMRWFRWRLRDQYVRYAKRIV